ncbi:ABC transporter substrate-binding protein [Saccharolobus shibatae]|uniref:ABC transporter, substrate-binding protein (Cluster 5, nickel/peptides/opines) n=1 Tax=Saccharolobus shibatae TaxID=2286 RepID=A0A8F5GYC2_9CREN|nr:ABC transporter substrate-binding protein [Saccharolobus shibatae]QXJ33931.1 ABC transporter, substrate-binding protein (cluster 5, nickel/peptides/opines) [Saccharolobus shibatae]
MRKYKIVSILVAFLMLINIAMFIIPATSQSTSVQPEGSMVVVPSPVGTWQDNFNPWNNPNNPAYMGEWLIYEPLALANPLNGEIIPWLATNWTWTTGYVNTPSGKVQTLALILYLRHDVYFTDGTPFNATAVWYTIGLEQAYPQLGQLANDVANMTIINPYELEIVFKPGQTPIILYTVLEQWIVDPAQWGKLFPIQQLPNGTIIALNKTGNPFTWSDPNPIGTGPYMLYSFSPQQIVLVANPHYWMPGEPRIKYLLYPAEASNVPADTALNNGQITWAGLFEPNIQQNFVAKDPAHYHYYFAPSSPQMVLFNDMRWPLTDPVLREAIYMAINRTAIYYLGEYGYEPPTTTPLPLPIQMLNVLNSSVLQMAEQMAPPQGNVTAALQLLESHGYKLVNGQLIAPNGTAVPTMTIMAPAGWTDWDADLSLIAQDLKQIGITVEVQTPPFSTWYNYMQTGNYWMGMIWDLITGPAPVFYFEGYLWNWWNSPGNVTPIGNTTYFNMERFNLTSSLAPSSTPANMLVYYAWGNLTNSEVENKLINDMAVLWLKYMPAFGVVYGANWYEYVNNTVTGWPTPQNYYWPAPPWESTGVTPLPVVLALHLVNQSVPEPWWYYTSQVPSSWYTSNDPFVYQTTSTSTTTTSTTISTSTTTTTTSTTTSTTTTTIVSTTTSVSTSVSTTTATVTSTVSSSSNTTLYAIIAVVVIIIIIAIVLGLRRR